MARYQATTIVSAAQWTGEVTAEIADLLGDHRHLLKPTDDSTSETLLVWVGDAGGDPDDADAWMHLTPGEWLVKVGDLAIDGYFEKETDLDFGALYAPLRDPLSIAFQIPTTLSQGPTEGSCVVTLHPSRVSYQSLLNDLRPTLGQILHQILHQADAKTLDLIESMIHEARSRATRTS